MAAAMAMMPRTAVPTSSPSSHRFPAWVKSSEVLEVARSLARLLVSRGIRSSSSGRYTNMNGKVKPTRAKRKEARAVFMILALAMEALA